MELKVREGYAIYDTAEKCYILDEDFDFCNDEEYPYIYNSIERAKEIIEEYSNYPENCEIHRIKITFQVEEVYKRNVVYSLVAGKVE